MMLSIYTPREACMEFQLDIMTVYRYLHQKKIPHVKIGGVFRIFPDGFLEQDFSSAFPQRLKTADVCNILKISAPTARRLIHEGVFPAVFYGRALRIPRDSFFSWLHFASVQPIKRTAVLDVSSFINDIMLSGGIYHGH